jgi:hypothetical protein
VADVSPICAALLAALAPGVSPADLDRSKVYEIPAAIVAQLAPKDIAEAKACAKQHGIRWKLVK